MVSHTKLKFTLKGAGSYPTYKLLKPMKTDAEENNARTTACMKTKKRRATPEIEAHTNPKPLEDDDLSK